MTSPPPADDEIAHLQDQIHALMGQVKAMEYGLRLLIAATSTPLLLRDAWGRMLPELLEHHEEPDQEQTLYKHGLVQGLKVISDQLNSAVDSNL